MFGHFLPRRRFLRSLAAGSLLLPGIVRQLLADDSAAPSGPHFTPKAKRVIFLYMTGGVFATASSSLLRLMEGRNSAIIGTTRMSPSLFQLGNPL
jgi:hypothetical protein